MPRCRDPLDPEGNAPLVTTPVCEHHDRRLRRTLEDAALLYVQLGLAIGIPAQRAEDDGARHTKAEAPPLPINVEARALQERLVRLLVEAEDDLRLALHLNRRPLRGREAAIVVGSSSFLAVRQEQLLAFPFGVELCVGVLQHHADSRRALGLTRLIHRLPAPCPTCDRMGLEREDGADFVLCRACGRLFTEDEYARLVLLLSEGLTL